jgi:hypothetical protein
MAQQDGKWIKNDTIKDNHIQLTNDQYLRARNNADTADVSILKVRTDDLVEFGIQPQFTGTPSINADLVNRGYVLDVLAGIRDPKDACKVGSTANVNIASAPANIDGIALAAGDRVLLKDQTLPAENGIYIFTAAAAVMLRSTDADTAAELTSGASTMITDGTLNARKTYVLTTADPIVIDTTALTFAQAPNPANFLIPKEYIYTILAGDIINGYIDLPHGAEAESIKLCPTGGPKQVSGTDFTISIVSNVSRITWAGDLASRIAAADELQVSYSYATA